MLRNAFLTGYYKSYHNVDKADLGLYEVLRIKSQDVGVGVYNILLIAAVFLSGIAWIVSAILLIIASKNSGGKLSEAKKNLIKTFVVSVCIFSVSGILTLVQALAIH